MSTIEGTSDPSLRTHIGGDQIVRCGRYAYRWRGAEPLKLGDRVQLPGNWVSPDGWEATVTGFGTTYQGSIEAVVRLVVDE